MLQEKRKRGLLDGKDLPEVPDKGKCSEACILEAQKKEGVGCCEYNVDTTKCKWFDTDLVVRFGDDTKKFYATLCHKGI